MPRFERQSRQKFCLFGKEKSEDPLKNHSEHRTMLNGLCDSAVFIVFFIAAIRPSHGRLLDLCGFPIVFQCHIYIIDENYNSSQAKNFPELKTIALKY